jgi:hypothetical protein
MERESRLEQHFDAHPKGGAEIAEGMLDETEKTVFSDSSSKADISRPNTHTTVEEDLETHSQRSDSQFGSSISSKEFGRSRTSHGTDLAQLEQDVLAKLRANPRNYTTEARNNTTRAQLAQLERDVAAKVLALAPPANAAPPTPGAHATTDPNPRRGTKSIGLARKGSVTKQEMVDASSPTLRSLLGASSLRRSQSLQLEDLEEAVFQKLGQQRLITTAPGGRSDQDTDVVIDIGDPEKEIDRRDNAEDGEYLTTLGGDPDDGAPQFVLPDGFPQNEIDPYGNAASTVSTDHGMFAEPEYEHGSYDGETGEHGYTHAVAVPVQEALTSAIEYDHDSKPPLFKNRRFRYYIMAAAVALVIIAVVTTMVAIYGFPESKTQPPSPAPTTEREGTSIRKQLVAVVGQKAMSDPASPAALAADWIINEDAMQVAPEADNLIQRFIMALFYISTTQEKEWLSCNRAKPGETDDCLYSKVLQIVPQFLYEEVDNSRWLSSVHECYWAGTFCDEFSQVRAFDLRGQLIRGTFPTEIAKMPYLQSLTFMWNEFYGTMPDELSNMKHLLNIELHTNYFTGTIPHSWYNSQAIQRISIGDNMLSGSIPTEIGQLETMKGLHIWDNMHTGTIPTEIGGMKFLCKFVFFRPTTIFLILFLLLTTSSFFLNLQLSQDGLATF